MKIQLLRKRENFLEIFQKSISHFFQEKFFHNDYVKIEYKINDYLNILYPSKISRNDLSELVSEFKYHSKNSLRILQTAYTFFAIRWPLEILASSGSVVISIPVGTQEKWVFIPGNHSIRVIDLEKNRCFVFLKYGFNKDFIKSDMNIRLEFSWLKAPRIIQKNNDWFEEQRVVGLPWNRLSSSDTKNNVIVKVRSQLLKLYQKTSVKLSIKDYVSLLSNSILSTLENSLSELLDKDKAVIKNSLNKLNIILLDSFGNLKVDLVITHGDFQPANILCSKDDFWIIDWEYSNRRSIFYDALVFDLECRVPIGLGVRLNEKMNQLSTMKDYLNWTGQSLNNSNSYYFAIFFLEDLLLRMREVSSDLIKTKSAVLSTYLTELSIIQEILINNIKD